MEKQSGQTGKVKEVKLESLIEQVVFTKNMASAGGKIGIDVFTKFVGNNSEIKIEIKDKSGKSGGTVKGKITGNRFWKSIDIPENLKDELTATAKLSKLGLEKKSNSIILLPPIKISNLKWDKNEARRGDILKLTADVKGAYDGAETTIEIFEHDNDGAHDLVVSFPALVKSQKIKTEWEFQYVEDTDDIPDDNEAENGYNNPEYFFRVTIAGVSEDSGLLKFKDTVEIVWRYENGQPAANQKFKIVTADGEEKQETFDGDGRYLFEDAPPGPYKIVLEDDNEEETSEAEPPADKTIKIYMKDPDGNKYSNKKYELRYGQKVKAGTTDGDGLLQEQIPPNILQAKLLFWLRDGEDRPSFSTILQLTDLEPDDSTAGIQERLQNLGYYAGRIDGEAGAMTAEAVRNFRKDNNMTVSGDIDGELRQKINEKF